jgi:hypothetical protein
MKGTAVLIEQDHTVKVLENVEHEVYEELVSQKHEKKQHCTIDDKTVNLGPIAKVVWCEETIDWNYGY